MPTSLRKDPTRPVHRIPTVLRTNVHVADLRFRITNRGGAGGVAGGGAGGGGAGGGAGRAQLSGAGDAKVKANENAPEDVVGGAVPQQPTHTRNRNRNRTTVQGKGEDSDAAVLVLSKCGKFYNLVSTSETEVIATNTETLQDPQRLQQALVSAAKAAVAEAETTRWMLTADLERIDTALAALPPAPGPGDKRASVRRTPTEISRRRLLQSREFLQQDVDDAQRNVGHALALFNHQEGQESSPALFTSVPPPKAAAAAAGVASAAPAPATLPAPPATTSSTRSGKAPAAALQRTEAPAARGWAMVRSWVTAMFKDHDKLSALVKQGAKAKSAIGDAVISHDAAALDAAALRFTTALNDAAADMSPRLAVANYKYDECVRAHRKQEPVAVAAVNACFEELANCITGKNCAAVKVGDECEVVDTTPRGYGLFVPARVTKVVVVGSNSADDGAVNGSDGRGSSASGSADAGGNVVGATTFEVACQQVSGNFSAESIHMHGTLQYTPMSGTLHRKDLYAHKAAFAAAPLPITLSARGKRRLRTEHLEELIPLEQVKAKMNATLATAQQLRGQKRSQCKTAKQKGGEPTTAAPRNGAPEDGDGTTDAPGRKELESVAATIKLCVEKVQAMDVAIATSKAKAAKRIVDAEAELVAAAAAAERATCGAAMQGAQLLKQPLSLRVSKGKNKGPAVATMSINVAAGDALYSTSTAKYVQVLFVMASEAHDELRVLSAAVASADPSGRAQVHGVSTKSVQRLIEKAAVKYNGDHRRVLDIARVTVGFQSFVGSVSKHVCMHM